MRTVHLCTTTVLASIACASAAQAQWITYANQTGTRMTINLPDGVSGDASIQIGNDPTEKDYAWGDVDRDGDTDLVFIRKFPLSNPGGKRNILFMNENGVLVDRTTLYATAALGVPGSEGVSQGFLDLTNDRHVLMVDLNNDGWLDLFLAGTIADGLPRYIGHPRVYMNLGNDGGGNWLGFRYEYARVPQLLSKSGVPANPRFCSATAGDINGDGYPDIYLVDYDTGEVGPPESSANDLDNKLLMNGGPANPGVFTDQTNPRMSALFNYPPNLPLVYSTFGAHGIIADYNGDAIKDVLKITTLNSPIHAAIKTNPGSGTFTTQSYKIVYGGAPYSVSTADLNGDGRLDLVMTDDSNDRYLINTGNDGNGAPSYITYGLPSDVSQDSHFGNQSTFGDLDNDGFIDFVIVDEDSDTFFPGGNANRRTRFYRHQGAAAPQSAMYREHSAPFPSLRSVYRVAIFDLNSDGWLDVVFGRGNPAGSNNAGSSEVWINNGKPGLNITYPGGAPSQLTPNAATNFQVTYTGIMGGALQANSAILHLSVNGGAFTPSNMSLVGGTTYQATIPAQPCGASVRYYVSGQTTSGATVLNPPAATYNGLTPTSHNHALVAGSTNVLLNETFERGIGAWQILPPATSGVWELAAPIGTWNEGVRAAPAAAHGGAMAFVTGNGVAGGAPGAASVHGGFSRLTSPLLNVPNNARISYWYWMYSNMPGSSLSVQVSSDDGANWVTVVNHAPPRPTQWHDALPLGGEVNAWKQFSFNVGDFVTPSSQVRVRFSVRDLATGHIAEAALDDLIVTVPVCTTPCLPDITGDGQVNVNDLLAVINAWGACPGCPADVTGDGQVNVNDLLAVINAWGACP